MLSLDLTMERPEFRLAVQGDWPVDRIIGIYGHSGAGKTSLLRGIAGLDPARGRVSLDTRPWLAEGCAVPTHRRDIAYVFQDARLMPHLSAAGNLRYALKRRRPNPGLDWDEVVQTLDLEPLLDRPAPQLSGGQAQRVALGRALLMRPRLLLLDEPLASLDTAGREPILDLLTTLPGRCGMGLIYVSHSLEEINRLAAYLVLMAGGEVIAQGPAMELLGRLDLPVAREDNAAALLSTRIAGHHPGDQLTELALEDGQRLWLAGLRGRPGQSLRLRIPARDVSLALSAAIDSSILNILRARVEAIRDCDDARVSLRLAIAGQWLLARVTRRSARQLQLAPGSTVYAQIKSVALLSDSEAAIHHA